MKKYLVILFSLLLFITSFAGRKTLFTFDLFIPALSDLYGTLQSFYKFGENSLVYSSGAGFPFVALRILNFRGSLNLEVLVQSNKENPVIKTDFRIGSYDFKIFLASKLWDSKFYVPFVNLNLEGGILWSWYRGYIKLGIEYSNNSFNSLLFGIIF